jgi:hypothetical protein
MARFWFPGGPAVRRTVETWLQSRPEGRILDEAYLRRCRVFFTNRRYGELFFLLHSGTILAPSYMNRGFVRGMHGYAPEAPDSAACLLSTHAPAQPVKRLSDLNSLLQTAGALAR